MKIICIARGRESKGVELAGILANKLGYSCYSREDLVEDATREGIAVGKLETAMLKPGLFNDRLTLEKEHYVAFATARLCERALDDDTVYHGRTGHLLLPGVAHVLRIRIVENVEDRIGAAMRRMRVSRDKARRFIEEVDDDIRRWGKTIYGNDWEDNSQYDLVLNLDQIQVANAAAALCGVAELTDFQETPASHQALENLHLAARVRVALARSPRTRTGHLRVTASKGVVRVTYRPQDLGLAQAIPAVAASVDGVREVHATLATTNVLWVQERFEPTSGHCAQVVELARGWNAVVDLMRVMPGDGNHDEAPPPPAPESATPSEASGGIEDDDDRPAEAEDDGGLEATHNLLSREGVAGGMHVSRGQAHRLSEVLDSQVKYFLVVLGDLFLDKGHATRLRRTRELAGTLGETLAAPVVGIDELRETYLFSVRQLAHLALYLAFAAAVFVAVFTHQVEVLRFLSSPETSGKLFAAAAVAVVVPLFAYGYGTFTKGVLRLLKIE